MNIIIAGAGMAGLLASNMLGVRHSVTVIEKAASLPNNHHALLRFRSSIVGDVLGLTFRKVPMIRTALPWMNPVADALAYSMKSGGVYRTDRSIVGGLKCEDRFIAPPDLVQYMAEGCEDIRFDTNLSECWHHQSPIVSTIPMPILMEMLEYPRRHEVDFVYRPGDVITAQVRACEAYCTLYTPDPAMPFSRISITGNELIVEASKVVWDAEHTLKLEPDSIAIKAAACFGLTHSDLILESIEQHRQTYAKIAPIPEELRKHFIHWATIEHNVFSLGRYATWRPGLLLDDVVNDIRLIEKWLISKSLYDTRLHHEGVI